MSVWCPMEYVCAALSVHAARRSLLNYSIDWWACGVVYYRLRPLKETKKYIYRHLYKYIYIYIPVRQCRVAKSQGENVASRKCDDLNVHWSVTFFARAVRVPDSKTDDQRSDEPNRNLWSYVRLCKNPLGDDYGALIFSALGDWLTSYERQRREL